jgi:hypothetical protein
MSDPERKRSGAIASGVIAIRWDPELRSFVDAHSDNGSTFTPFRRPSRNGTRHADMVSAHHLSRSNEMGRTMPAGDFADGPLRNQPIALTEAISLHDQRPLCVVSSA